MDIDDSNIDRLLVPSPIYGQTASPEADELTFGETGTLAEGRSGDPVRRMLEIKASPSPLCLFFTLSLPVLDCGLLGKS